MMRWTCEYCKCLYIADCLDTCPHCYTKRGDNVPKISKQYGPTSRYEEPVTTPAEDTPVEPVAEKPVRRTRKPRTAAALPGSYVSEA